MKCTWDLNLEDGLLSKTLSCLYMWTTKLFDPLILYVIDSWPFYILRNGLTASYFLCYRLLTFLYTNKWIDCIYGPSLKKDHNASLNVIVHHSIDILRFISSCILTNLSSCSISYSSSIISWSITSRSSNINSFTREF